MKLCITEKPNVAEIIAKVIGANIKHDGFYEGNGFYVTWCVGHLITLSYPDVYDPKYKDWKLSNLPFLPSDYKLEVIKSTEPQFNVIKRLIHQNDVDMIIDCGDAGREGCNIQNLVRLQAGCQKPVKRLWISSLTEKAIHNGFENLRDISEYDDMTKAAWARMRKDYIVGINATRAISSKYGNGKVLNCGLAQTPTLGLIVAQTNKVEEYVSENYYTIDIQLENELHAKYFTDGDEKITFSGAKKIESVIIGNSLKIVKILKKKKKIERPKLYDLTTLQIEANTKYQYSAKETLDLCQSLYEKRLITYPRTSSKFLPEDMREEFAKRLTCINGIKEYEELSTFFATQDLVMDDRIFDDKGLSDHHAIIVTEEIDKIASKGDITEKEMDILHLIIQKMYLSVCESYIYEETTILYACDDLYFVSRLSQPIRLGWKWLDAQFEKKELKKKELAIPDLVEGDCIPVTKVNIEEKKKSGPKYFTESSLLYAMENVYKFLPDETLRKKIKGHGIGTEATRADIIEGLISHGYVKRERKNKVVYLLPTQKGINLISIMPEELVSYILSAEWEIMLDEIENGSMNDSEFMDIVFNYTIDLVDMIKNTTYKVAFNDELPVGKCPRCGFNVFEKYSKSKDILYACENKECKFVLFKNDKSFFSRTKNSLKKGQIKLLLEGKSFVADCISNTTNKKYRAVFGLNDTGSYVNVQMTEFAKNNRDEKR